MQMQIGGAQTAAPKRTNRAWSAADVEELKRLWGIHAGRMPTIARVMGRTKGSIDGKSRVLGLQFHGGRAITLKQSDNAARHAHTTFPSRVIEPDHNVLKSGDNQRKLGRVVKKGRWKGMPIFSLTLEERATCPRSCALWLGCYGNGMGHAKRYAHGPELERQIAIELAFLQRRHPDGFVVRLHILGDFYSEAYVRFWRICLDQFAGLHVFGYTARQLSDPIGKLIADLRGSEWRRFAVRTSGAAAGPRTLVVETSGEANGAIVWPAQTGKTANCASCALCWQTDRPIAFVRH
jgi:hypothetical protein